MSWDIADHGGQGGSSLPFHPSDHISLASKYGPNDKPKFSFILEVQFSLGNQQIDWAYVLSMSEGLLTGTWVLKGSPLESLHSECMRLFLGAPRVEPLLSFHSRVPAICSFPRVTTRKGGASQIGHCPDVRCDSCICPSSFAILKTFWSHYPLLQM